MEKYDDFINIKKPRNKTRSKPNYERFGEIIRYLTVEELKLFFDTIDIYQHKLMFEVIYELGCRVGEFVKIQVKHINFRRSTVFFPAENTKTKHARTGHLPQGVTNEIKSMLKEKGITSKRDDKIKKPQAYVFHPGKRWNHQYTENRIRQIFQRYIKSAGLHQVYGRDSYGRQLKMFTVHSLRHSHIMHYTVDLGLPLPIVQKQVGHRNLKTTSVYLSASTEKVAEAYKKVRQSSDREISGQYTPQLTSA